MPKQRNPRPALQPDLFHPPQILPPWSTLPSQTRQRTIQLLAHLLRAHRARQLGCDTAKEACDD